MWTDELRIARDYNRGLPAPIRWAHLTAAAVRAPIHTAGAWAAHETRRRWALPLIAGLIAFFLLLPLDGPIIAAVSRLQLGGDLKRELEALQQFGQGSSIIILTAVVWLMDPPRRRHLADWGLALALAGIAVNVLKLFVGRPRPKFNDPLVFLGPFGKYPVEGAGVRHAWEIGSGISSDLWSFPSSHTVYAVVMAVFLSLLYPRLRGLMIVLAVVVGLSRVLFRAHYPTDVVAGALVGWLIAFPVIARSLGVRLLGLDRPRRARAAAPDHESEPADIPTRTHYNPRP